MSDGITMQCVLIGFLYCTFVLNVYASELCLGMLNQPNYWLKLKNATCHDDYTVVTL